MRSGSHAGLGLPSSYSCTSSTGRVELSPLSTWRIASHQDGAALTCIPNPGIPPIACVSMMPYGAITHALVATKICAVHAVVQQAPPCLHACNRTASGLAWKGSPFDAASAARASASSSMEAAPASTSASFSDHAGSVELAGVTGVVSVTDCNKTRIGRMGTCKWVSPRRHIASAKLTISLPPCAYNGLDIEEAGAPISAPSPIPVSAGCFD